MTVRLTWPRYVSYWLVGLLATALIGWLCLHFGYDARGVSFHWPAPEILQFRLVRVGTAALVGAALAASGVLLQALLRNPLADPYVLGESANTITTYGYDPATGMQEPKVTLCQIRAA